MKISPKPKLSIWTFLKSFSGNSISRLDVPIYYNEPLSLLQKNAEIMASQQLLVAANNNPNSSHRLAHVAAFSAAQFSCLAGRKLKPLNAVLGETFEIVTEGFRYCSEQVSKGTAACHAENNDYVLNSQTCLKCRGVESEWEFNPVGAVNVRLKRWEEEYEVERPCVIVKNMKLESLYLDCVGKSIIINRKTKEKCVLEYREKGLSESSYGILEGFVMNSDGDKLIEIRGKWTDYVEMRDINSNKVEMLWKCPSVPKDLKNQYSLPAFVVEMNKLTKELEAVLPPTDSRLRPDIRALEDNDIKLASNEKYRLEEIQREKLKVMKNKKVEHRPVYFEESIDSISGEKEYKFNGKYWEDREKGNWSHLPTIY
eukprot:TRINITY_DN1039_c0_g1_i10.p1 TRINITY_DN1039_c0_g1~~TRINITY_DN1039_c0_g1_i10.p1  ORF type:complete len:370 (+),score=88.99 TRINITY_DN1039_c0_g1_i10:1098-2207(+)